MLYSNVVKLIGCSDKSVEDILSKKVKGLDPVSLSHYYHILLQR